MPAADRRVNPVLLIVGAVALGAIVFICAGVGTFGFFWLKNARQPQTAVEKPTTSKSEEVTQTANPPKSTDEPRPTAQRPTREVPPVEITDGLKALEINFGSWRVEGSLGTTIVGVVKPTKLPLERVSRYIGREIQVSVYDKNGLKLSGASVAHPDLQPGESGKIEIHLPYQYPYDKIGRIVLDKK